MSCENLSTWAEIFNKTSSFEVNIACCSSFQLSHQNNPCYGSLMKIYQHGAEIFNKTSSFEASIGFYPTFQLSHQKNPHYGSLMIICQHGADIFNKMCSFEVSIGLLPLNLIISYTWAHLQGVTICGLITEVKQLQAQLVLGWVTI